MARRKSKTVDFEFAAWMADPCVSRCSPATRGIWFDLLCHMFSTDSHFVEGTAAEISRLCRCSAAQFEAAAEELRATGTAGVVVPESLPSNTTFGIGVEYPLFSQGSKGRDKSVTSENRGLYRVVSRRRRREAEAADQRRKSWRQRQKRKRGDPQPENVTGVLTLGVKKRDMGVTCENEQKNPEKTPAAAVVGSESLETTAAVSERDSWKGVRGGCGGGKGETNSTVLGDRITRADLDLSTWGDDQISQLIGCEVQSICDWLDPQITNLQDESTRKLILGAAVLWRFGKITDEEWHACIHKIKRVDAHRRLAYWRGCLRGVIDDRGGLVTFESMLAYVNVPPYPWPKKVKNDA